MMKTDREYEAAKAQLSKLQELYNTQVAELMSKKNFTEEQAKDALSSSMTYALQCKEELDLYEKLKKGILPPAEHFSSKGRYFIAARIAKGMTQRDLAEQLGVKETAVSRDERFEYQGLSMDKAERLSKVLGLKLLLTA